MKSKYDWKSYKTKLLRQLRMSKHRKIKSGWSREMGAGFIKEDINFIKPNLDEMIVISYCKPPFFLITTPFGLNLRETEEAIKFLEGETR